MMDNASQLVPSQQLPGMVDAFNVHSTCTTLCSHFTNTHAVRLNTICLQIRRLAASLCGIGQNACMLSTSLQAATASCADCKLIRAAHQLPPSALYTHCFVQWSRKCSSLYGRHSSLLSTAVAIQRGTLPGTLPDACQMHYVHCLLYCLVCCCRWHCPAGWWPV